jgi:hypothetical protein
VPSKPKPKQFVAARRFLHRGHRYEVGEPVTDRRTIDNLVRYGDQFIRVKRAPAVDTATNPPKSTKED